MLLSIAVPVHNEKEALPQLLAEVRKVATTLDWDYELILVDDGSTDGTSEMLAQAAASDPHIKVLFFSRNFGHQVAITAAIDHASGDATVVMDADLQDPPTLLPQMLELIKQGYDVVSAQRTQRENDTWFKRTTADAFYRLMRAAVDPRLAPHVGDFRMFSRRAVVALRQLPEKHRFMRGMVAWLGLKEAIVTFERQPRVAGETKYPLRKMLRFAWTAISSFSALPLRLSIYFGIFITIGGILYAIWSMYEAFIVKATVQGWTSLIVLNVIFSGTILIAIGMVGEYLARVYEESKGRPLYIVSHATNFAPGIRPANGIVLPPAEISETQHARTTRKNA
jgi:glycosyltransferase involved in cell wall biosynthesis